MPPLNKPNLTNIHAIWIFFFGMIIGWRNRRSSHPAMTVTVTIPQSAILAKEAAQPLKAKA